MSFNSYIILQKKSILGLLIGTFLIIIFSFYNESSEWGLVRECVLVVSILFRHVISIVSMHFFKDEIELAESVSLQTNTALACKYPLFNLQPFFLLVLAFCTRYGLPNEIHLRCATVIILFYGIVYFCYRSYCVYKSPELFVKYTSPRYKAIKGSRFMSTATAAKAGAALPIGKILAFGTTGIILGTTAEVGWHKMTKGR